MKQSRIGLVCALSGGLVCAANQAAFSETAANPYQGIVDRNLFGLKPIPPPPPPVPDTPPAPKITLTGITTILGKKQVLMKVVMATKPPEQPKEQSLILAEGERDGEIEVVDVDVQSGTVKLNDYGTPLTLNLDKDGAKLPSTPAPAGPGGAPGMPAVAGAAANPFQPGGMGQGNPGLKSLPTRTLRMPQSGGGPVGGAGMSTLGAPMGGLGSASPGVMINPGLAAQPQGLGQKNWPPENPGSPEEQAILLEAQREVNKGNPNFPPLPSMLTPTPPTPTPNQTPGRPPLPQ